MGVEIYNKILPQDFVTSNYLRTFFKCSIRLSKKILRMETFLIQDMQS